MRVMCRYSIGIRKSICGLRTERRKDKWIDTESYWTVKGGKCENFNVRFWALLHVYCLVHGTHFQVFVNNCVQCNRELSIDCTRELSRDSDCDLWKRKKQSWKASQKPRAKSRKPKNFGCKKLKAEKKFWWWERKAKSFIFLQLFGFLPIFLVFWWKKSQSRKASYKPRVESRKLKNFGCKKLKAEKSRHQKVESQKFYHRW